jgi:hypothetical protein
MSGISNLSLHLRPLFSPLGFNEDTLLRAAGAVQIIQDLIRKQTKVNPGWPWGSWPYGDQTQDQAWVSRGVFDFNNFYMNWYGVEGSWDDGATGDW